MESTSPKNNKIIVIYSDYFFKTIFTLIQNQMSDLYEDASGTVWHIDDIYNILTKRKVI